MGDKNYGASLFKDGIGFKVSRCKDLNLETLQNVLAMCPKLK